MTTSRNPRPRRRFVRASVFLLSVAVGVTLAMGVHRSREKAELRAEAERRVKAFAAEGFRWWRPGDARPSMDLCAELRGIAAAMREERWYRPELVGAADWSDVERAGLEAYRIRIETRLEAAGPPRPSRLLDHHLPSLLDQRECAELLLAFARRDAARGAHEAAAAGFGRALDVAGHAECSSSALLGGLVGVAVETRVLEDLTATLRGIGVETTAYRRRLDDALGRGRDPEEARRLLLGEAANICCLILAGLDRESPDGERWPDAWPDEGLPAARSFLAQADVYAAEARGEGAAAGTEDARPVQAFRAALERRGRTRDLVRALLGAAEERADTGEWPRDGGFLADGSPALARRVGVREDADGLALVHLDVAGEAELVARREAIDRRIALEAAPPRDH
ncbi:MAG: hypothetical protein R3F20_00180 [Planctomycetota bacterium]